MKQGRGWNHPMSIGPQDVPVLCGESTGKARKRRVRPEQEQKQQHGGALQPVC
jgi:hypothetical protein